MSTATRHRPIQTIAQCAVCLLTAGALLSGCGSCTGEESPPGPDAGDAADAVDPSDSDPRDARTETGTERDSGPADADAVEATDGASDSSATDTDTAGADTATDTDGADGSPPSDATDTDAGGDTRVPDASDAGSDADASPPGLSVPCSNGSGWTVFKFHWSQNGGRSPSIDVWDASCRYSTAIGSTCRVSLLHNPDFNSRQPRAVTLSGSEAIRVRYDVSTLQFTDAAVHVQARSYATTSPTRFEVWSPIYGAKTSPGLVDQDFVYDWYTVPWGNYLSPSDDPNLTAIEISDLGGDELAVHAVELCVQ